jgi:hypothetical protein
MFVPDANILLHCLRHSSEIREELLRILELLKGSLWIPYQIGIEFHRHRLDVEGSSADAYDRLVKDYESILGQAREKLRQLRAHPSISVERELSALNMFLDDFRNRMEQAKAQHPAAALAQAVIRITAIFEGRVGAKPTPDKLAAIRKEGEDRYSRHIPPGYKDIKKAGLDSDKFGDLIIWKDLIEKAKADGRPLIFITDDVKEDWWQIHRGRKLGPRPELLEEFRLASGQDFHIYELGQFLRIAAERHKDIAQEKVDQIEKSVLEDEQARRRTEIGREESDLRARVLALENERDSIISHLAGVPSIDSIRQGSIVDKDFLRARLAEIDRELVSAQSSLEESKED